MKLLIQLHLRHIQTLPARSPARPQCQRSAATSYPRFSYAQRAGEQSTQPSPAFSSLLRERSSHCISASSRGALQHQGAAERPGEEPTQCCRNPGLFPRVLFSPCLRARWRQLEPDIPHPARRGRSLELPHKRRECRIVRAHGWCAGMESLARFFFLLKFKTCCTQRPELMKAKLTLKDEKSAALGYISMSPLA